MKFSATLILAVILLSSGCAFFSKSAQTSQTKQQPPHAEPVKTPQPEPVSELQIKRPTRLGLVLGPGGAKALAHVGVLKALEASRLPVVGIVGIEWGALVGAVYSQKASIHDMEWKLYKLERTQLPGRAMLSKKINPEPMASLREFLRESFRGGRLEQFQKSFACASQSLSSGAQVLFNSGAAETYLERCLPLPPLFEAKSEWFADIHGLESAIQYLHSLGADIVILSDVLAQPSIAQVSELKIDQPSAILWTMAQQQMRSGWGARVQVLKLDTRNFTFDQFTKRQELTELGEKSATLFFEKLITQDGFER